MSSENCVRIVMAEYLRFPGVGSSAPGKPGAKARPEGVVDAQTVDIPLPLIDLSILTQHGSLTRALVAPGERDRNIVGKQTEVVARKGICISTAPVPQTDTGR